MLFELCPVQFNKARNMYSKVSYQLSAESVLDQNNPGKVFVDDINFPTASFMKAPEGFIIAGNPRNPSFNIAIKDYFNNTIYPERLGSSNESWDIYYDETWEKTLYEIFEGKSPMKHPRMYFVAKSLVHRGWANNIPQDFEFLKIDKQFLKRTGLKNYDQVRSRVDEWGSVSNFLNKGFGFCLVHDNVIVSRCIADCVSKNRAEIGIGTDEEYRKRGFGVKTVLGTLEYCFNNGFEQIGWHCSAFNIASQKTAIKSGFVKELDYYSLWANFNTFSNMISNAYHHLYQERDMIAGQNFIVKAMEMGSIETQHWYGWARGFALCGNLEKTIEYLNRAIKHGWSDKNTLINDNYFNNLHISKAQLLQLVDL